MGFAQKLGGLQKGVGLKGLCIHHHHIGHCSRTLGEARTRTAQQQLAAIGTDVHQPRALATEGKALGESTGHVITGKVSARTETGLAVVHLHNLVDVSILLGPLFSTAQYQVVLRGSKGDVSLGHISGQKFANTRQGIEFIKVTLTTLGNLLQEGGGAGHPSPRIVEFAQEAATLGIAQLIVPMRLAVRFNRLAREHRVFSIGREGDAAHPTSVGQVVHHQGVSLFQGVVHGLRSIEHYADRVGILRLGEIADGQSVVVGSQLQFALRLLSIDIEFVVLRALHLQLAFQEVAVVDVEAEHSHTALALHTGQHLPTEGGGSLSRQGNGLQLRSGVVLLARHIHGVHTQRGGHPIGTCEVELFNLCLVLRLHRGGKCQEGTQ